MPTLTIADITLDAGANAAVIQWLATQGTGIQSTLAADITSGAVTLSVSVANWQPAINRLIGIDNEVCLVTAKAGSVLTVTRARGGTTAAAHTAGALVRDLKYSTKEEGMRDLLVQFIRNNIRNDATLNAGVTSAIAARDAAVEAGVV